VAAASILAPMVGTGLTICSNAEARESTRWVLQYLESLKNVESEQEGNQFSFTASGYLLISLTSSFVCSCSPDCRVGGRQEGTL
jgi:hypothetical protein